MKEYTLHLEAGCPTGRGHAPQWAALTISEGFYGYLLGLQGLCKAHSLNRVVQDAKVQEWAPAEDCEHFGALDCEIVLDEFSFRHQAHDKYGVDLVETASVSIRDMRKMLDFAQTGAGQEDCFALHDGALYYADDESDVQALIQLVAEDKKSQ